MRMSTLLDVLFAVMLARPRVHFDAKSTAVVVTETFEPAPDLPEPKPPVVETFVCRRVLEAVKTGWERLVGVAWAVWASWYSRRALRAHGWRDGELAAMLTDDLRDHWRAIA